MLNINGVHYDRNLCNAVSLPILGMGGQVISSGGNGTHFGSNPSTDKDKWYLIKLNDGTYNIVSYNSYPNPYNKKSYNYLDGSKKTPFFAPPSSKDSQKWIIEDYGDFCYIRVKGGVFFNEYTPLPAYNMAYLRDNWTAAGLSRDLDDKCKWRLSPAGELEFVNIEYIINPNEKPEPMPLILETNRLYNNSSVSQSRTVTFTLRYTESSTFNQSSSISVTNSVSGGLKVPGLTDGKVSTSVTSTNTWSYGKSESKEFSINYSFPLIAPPFKEVEAKAFVECYKIKMDYIITLRSKINGALIKVKGKWEGMQKSNSDYVINQKDI